MSRVGAAQIAHAYAADTDRIAEWIRLWAAAGAELPAHDVGLGEVRAGMLPNAIVGRLDQLKGPAFDHEFR